jgi:P27 family predicted phage terminase small subunit
VWDRIVPGLVESGVVVELDGDALALYCETTSRARQAWDEVMKDGLTVTSITGVQRPHPAAAIAHRADQLRLQLMAEFGLTPSSRAHVKADATPRDALADFLGRKGTP